MESARVFNGQLLDELDLVGNVQPFDGLGSIRGMLRLDLDSGQGLLFIDAVEGHFLFGAHGQKT